MNNIPYITIQNFEWVEDQLLNFDLLPTDELISIADNIRAEKGFEDEAVNPNNDVWYNFYLDVDIVKQTVRIWFSCNNGEKDDYANYDISMTDSEKEQFLWKAFRQFAKEMDQELELPMENQSPYHNVDDCKQTM